LRSATLPYRRAAPRQDFVLNYEGWGEWALTPATVVDLPSQPAGMLVSAVPLAVPVTAGICGQPALVDYAGLAQPGLNQFNITVPNVPTGLCSVILSVQGLSTQDGVVIPIGP
jgi:uncharacterized protein (TIGR03437 family)